MSPFESVIVLPQLSDSSAASSSACCSTRSASLKSKRPRSAASIVLHGPVSSARRAALTALSTSAALPAATLAITSPVAGLNVSNSPPSTGSIHLLSMNSLVSLTLGRAGADATFVAIVVPHRTWGGIVPRFEPNRRRTHETKSSPRLALLAIAFVRQRDSSAFRLRVVTCSMPV